MKLTEICRITLEAGEEVVALVTHRGDLFAVTNKGRVLLVQL